MNVGVIGYGSWIAERLIARFDRDDVRLIDREEVSEPDTAGDLSGLDAVFLFAGRARPTEQEMEDERILIAQIAGMSDDRRPRLLLYLGSELLSGEGYGDHKLWCEETLMETILPEGKRIVVMRAPAVFGPGQSVRSPMLVPSLARTRGDLDLRTPDFPTDFVFVEDLVDDMIETVRYWNEVAMPGGFYRNIRDRVEFRRRICATPRQLRSLYQTWDSYRE